MKVFTNVLTVCYAQGLIEKKMFAVDGCKISSNCSKEWSGTHAELEKKAKRIEESIEKLVDRHRGEDDQPVEPDQREREDKAIEHLEKNAQRIRTNLSEQRRTTWCEWEAGEEQRYRQRECEDAE